MEEAPREPNPFLEKLVTTENEGTLRFNLCEHGEVLNVLVTGPEGKAQVVTLVTDRAKLQRQIHEAVEVGIISTATHEVLCFALWHYHYGARGWTWRTHQGRTCMFRTRASGSPADVAGLLASDAQTIYEA